MSKDYRKFGRKLWQSEVHLQFDLMSHVFINQSMDMHSHTRDDSLDTMENPSAGSSVKQEIGLVLHVQ